MKLAWRRLCAAWACTTPQAVATILNKEIRSSLQKPDVRAACESSGADPVFGSPEEAAALIRREVEMNGLMLNELGVSMEQ